MNVLFAMYGDSRSNSAHPMALHAQWLQSSGNHCAVAVPADPASGNELDAPAFPTFLYREILANPTSLFPDGRPADVVHAWTPREGVRRFCAAYLSKHPTPLVIYLEDNEEWIAHRALAMAGMPDDAILQHAESVIATWTPEGISHYLHYPSFIGLADAAVVIQDKLASEVPAWVPCTTAMPGVDLELFSPRPANAALRKRYGVRDDERVIVYNGGLNDFTRPGLEALCRAVSLIAQGGTPCRLLRTGPVPLDFLHRLATGTVELISELGVLPRSDIPDLLALADVLVQPGKHEPFEDLRLPGKLPEFFASGRPVVLPDTNISYLLRDGIDAVIHRMGTPEEIAAKCLELFADPERARRIGEAGRKFAETHFDPRNQAARLEAVYEKARADFDPELSRKVWGGESASVPMLLARKLRLMAQTGRTYGATVGPLLEAQAQCIEAAQAREKGLETGMHVRDQHIAVREEEIAIHKREIAALRESVAERHGHVVSLTQTVAERDLQIATLESTLSWRITRPLRAAGELARKLTAAVQRQPKK